MSHQRQGAYEGFKVREQPDLICFEVALAINRERLVWSMVHREGRE